MFKIIVLVYSETALLPDDTSKFKSTSAYYNSVLIELNLIFCLFLLLLSSFDLSTKANPAAPKSPNFCTQTQSSAVRYLLHFDCHFSTGRGSASQPAWRKGSCWCTLLPKCGTDSGSSATWWLAGGGVKLAIEPEGPVSANSKPNQPQRKLKVNVLKFLTCLTLGKQDL